LAIPAVFVIDRDGKFALVDARGKLDEVIRGLLGARAANERSE
jgi:hypothetical protein